MNLNLLTRIFKVSMLICFATFMALYVTNKMGYDEYRNSKKTVLTNEKIKQFETDVAEGKNVTLEDYLPKEINYQNKLSRLGLKISDTTSLLVKSAVQKSFKIISKLGEQ